MDDGSAAEYIMQALEGSARKEILSQPAADVRSAQIIFDIIEDTFGDKRGLSTLLSSFHGRRQGMAEGVLEYAQSLQLLREKINNAAEGTISNTTLRDRFVDGLYPQSLRRDIRRFVRENEGVSFHQARAEAQRWMREDSEADSHLEQVIATPAPKELEELKTQLTTLMKKTEELQAQLIQQTSQQSGRKPQCWYCHKPGHRQMECRSRLRDNAPMVQRGQPSRPQGRGSGNQGN